MPRIPTDTPIPEALREVFAAASNNRQPPLNVHRQMVHSPAVLVAYVTIRKALQEHGVLDPRTRFAVMLVTSAQAGVGYTTAVNSVLAARAGFDPSEIDAMVAGGGCGDAKLDRLLDLARSVVANGGSVPEDVVQAALEAGYSSAELAELFVSIQLASFVNQFVNYAQTPFDVPTAAEAA